MASFLLCSPKPGASSVWLAVLLGQTLNLNVYMALELNTGNSWRENGFAASFNLDYILYADRDQIYLP